jgi:hypothetical protein
MAAVKTYPRYRPERPLPAYAHIQDKTPHPRNHPDGHSYGTPDEPSTPLDLENWRTHEGYLFGVDLYNHGYPWEAHEAWEGPWRLGVPRSLERLYLQGLIQCAAAVVKALAGQPAGVATLSETALDILGHVAQARGPGCVYMGLALEPFVDAFRSYAARYPRDREAWPRIELLLDD